MSGAGAAGGRRRFDFSAFRTISIGVLSVTFVLLITVALLVGIRNLLVGMNYLPRASVPTAIELASKYCQTSPGSVTESPFKNLKGIWAERAKSLKTSPEQQTIRIVLSDAEATFLNVISHHTGEMPLSLSGGDSTTLVKFIPPKEPRPEVWKGEAEDFEGGTLEMDAWSAVYDSLNAINWIPYYDFRKIELPHADLDASKKYVELSTRGNCEWKLSKHPAPQTKILLGHLIAATTGINNFGPFGTYYASLAYLYFDSWRGNYVLTFTNTAIEGSDNPLGMSILFPIAPGSTFIENAIGLAMLGWTVCVLALGMAVIWLVVKPLRTIGRASREAGQIIRMDDGVPRKLLSLAEGLRPGALSVREYRNLLRELSSLLEEREFWLGTLLHQLKNDIQAVIMGLVDIQHIPGKAGSELEDINKATGRIRNSLNNVATYQWTSFGTPEPTRVIELVSVLETIVDDITDAGGDAIRTGDDQLYVVAQKAALESALQNLLWNAHHHGGKIEVKIRKADEQGKVEIVIDDDGPGIQEDMTEEMFKPYTQGHKRPDKSDKIFRGAGLGLAIARRVISIHGGEISISNRKSADESVAGLRVRVVLPLHKLSDASAHGTG